MSYCFKTTYFDRNMHNALFLLKNCKNLPVLGVRPDPLAPCGYRRFTVAYTKGISSFVVSLSLSAVPLA